MESLFITEGVTLMDYIRYFHVTHGVDQSLEVCEKECIKDFTLFEDPMVIDNLLKDHNLPSGLVANLKQTLKNYKENLLAQINNKS